MAKVSKVDIYAALFEHPETPQQVADLDALREMSRADLTELAIRLGIEVEKLPSVGRQYLGSEERSTGIFCDEYPFEGVIKFPIEISMGPAVVKRSARVRWKYKPEWTYWDPRTQRLKFGWWGCEMQLQIETAPREGEDWSCDWIDVSGLLRDGILDPGMRRQFDMTMDMKAREIDRKRRVEHAEQQRAVARHH